MREIVLDTETTGFNPGSGHRIVEIACLELMRRLPTGREFRTYLNPERDIPPEALAIHGLTGDFLAEQPLFADVAQDFLDFIGDAPLVIHNAQFDLGFLNAEFARVGLPPIAAERAVDTVALARQRFPGAQASLDALCRRFEIDNTARTLHGALLDCQLLAEVYLELRGGRQPGLDLDPARARAAAPDAAPAAPARPACAHAPGDEELAAHEKLLDRIEKPIWRQ